MTRDYTVALLNETARLFGVQASQMFAGSRDQSVINAESAVIYALWVTQTDRRQIGVWLGGDLSIMERVAACTRVRTRDAIYSDRVGQLVWFAQRWTGRAAA